MSSQPGRNGTTPGSSLGSLRYRLWRERRALARSEARLNSLRRTLADHVYNLDKWSFADRPSEYEDRHAAIYRLIQQYEALGGDALDVLPYRFEYLAEKAMPYSFERRQTGHNSRWETHRVTR